MNSSFWKKAVPHLIAVVIFLVVAMLYCKPALEGSHWTARSSCTRGAPQRYEPSSRQGIAGLS